MKKELLKLSHSIQLDVDDLFTKHENGEINIFTLCQGLENAQKFLQAIYDTLIAYDLFIPNVFDIETYNHYGDLDEAYEEINIRNDIKSTLSHVKKSYQNIQKEIEEQHNV